MDKKKEIKRLFEEAGGIVSTKELVKRGVSHYYIKKLQEDHFIELIKRGIYKLSDVEVDEKFEVSTMIPKGIFCMYTAASIHELTTHISLNYHVAIPKKSKVKVADYPPVQLYYWDTKQYTIGIQEIQKDNTSIAIYDPEKTVCDFLKFRNKVGFNDAKEVLKTYLNRKDRNIDKLVKYAKQLRVYAMIDQYLKILV